jgi:transposase-like protein
MKRNRYSAEKKVSILREHLEKNISIADICDKYRIHPNQLYRWKKEFFENAVEIFSTQRGRKKNDTTTIELENKIKERNEVIAELLQENLKLKKFSGEI